MSGHVQEIALNAWDQYQNLIRESSVAIWKIRTAFYAVSSALFAAGYTSGQPFVYIIILLSLILFLTLEAGHKRIQMQYILRSLEIERTLTDILVGEVYPYLPSGGVSTNLSTPTCSEIKDMFSLKRFLFWMPYLSVAVVALTLFYFDIQKQSGEHLNLLHRASLASRLIFA